ncbi:putative bifunctional diguanylate cyclase/phosphodiesterase [Streptomyces lichenis]|uniref:Bifunctional diguanylate cyclase/phosphodiesterase n=1 Tax=Streptomyces lichenis TaxID=2306967 RepID=A0ABT0IDT3_9ACTN|nr:bifunctional diguanylate cyclase/phosphodiesterase [Streptomyces lichenis]MCK8679435.1 bifunctional diguanylate cyclase/phosphodiesterase [Streptomyces lichenis]
MSAPGVLVERPPAATGGGTAGPRAGGGLGTQLVLAVLCGGYATGAALGWGSPEMALVMGDFGLSGAALVASVSCLVYARTRDGRFRPAWLLFAFSSAMAAAGNGVWGWYEVVLDRPVPTPSLADLFFLLFAPPAIVGLLVLAKRPVTRAGWVCLGLDSWLIGGSLLTLSWSLALAHTAHFRGETVARAALSLAYPLLDIVLVSMVLALHFRRSQAGRSAVHTAVAALALTVLCDALFTSPLLREHYASGQLLDAGWFAGSLLLAYAPWGARRAGVRPPVRRPAPEVRGGAGRSASRPVAGSLAALTPYLAAAVCTLGILYNAVEDRSVDRVVVFTACTVVLALVIRQGIMLMDNIALTHELAQKENHFRSLVQDSSDVIMIAAPNGTLRYVSPAASGVYGREADELIGSELAALIHPDDLGGVVHEVRRFLAAPPTDEPTTRIECRFRSGAGDWLNVESTVNRHQGGLIFNSRDVTERVRLQAQLQHNAEHDALTELPNRALFTRRVRGALGGRRAGDAGTAVLFIDLDGFKGVNDRLGHQAGDELLIQAARRLQESVRAGDTAARLGGDEFAALILGGAGHDEADRELLVAEIAERLRHTLSRPYEVDGGREVRVAASIGVAFAEPGLSSSDLLRNADLAMYRAKAGGKNRVELYGPHLGEGVPQAVAGGVRRAAVPAGASRHAAAAAHAPAPHAGAPVHPGGAPARTAVPVHPDAPPLLTTTTAPPPLTTTAVPTAIGATTAPMAITATAGPPISTAAPLTATAGPPVSTAPHPGAPPPAATRPARTGPGRASDGGPGSTRGGPPRSAARRGDGGPRPYQVTQDLSFALLHQPVVDLATGRITAVAAQPRHRSPQGILLTPTEFLRVTDLAELTELATEAAERTAPPGPGRPAPGTADRAAGRPTLSPRPAGGDDPAAAERPGAALLERAVAQAAERAALGHLTPVSVRLPARGLLAAALPAGTVEKLLTRYGLPSGSLVIELSDSDPRLSFEELERRLTTLRRLGVRIALDGFGSGYAAINALRRLPVDILKLDRGLVDNVVESARLHKITSGLLRIACDLGMQSVADGVDEPEQIHVLRAMGCTHGQGTVFSGPLDEHRLRRALTRGEYPLPLGAGLPVLSGGTLPAMRSYLTLRPHRETRIPPT